jgi:hypothetical protein
MIRIRGRILSNPGEIDGVENQAKYLKIIFKIIYFTFSTNILFCLKGYGYFVFLFLSFSPSILLGEYSNFAYIKANLYYFGINF